MRRSPKLKPDMHWPGLKKVAHSRSPCGPRSQLPLPGCPNCTLGAPVACHQCRSEPPPLPSTTASSLHIHIMVHMRRRSIARATCAPLTLSQKSSSHLPSALSGETFHIWHTQYVTTTARPDYNSFSIHKQPGQLSSRASVSPSLRVQTPPHTSGVMIHKHHARQGARLAAPLPPHLAHAHPHTHPTPLR